MVVAQVVDMRFEVREVGNEPGYLAYWLRRWRAEAGMTAKEASEGAGLTPSRMSDYENGARIQLADVYALTDAYGIPQERVYAIYMEEERRRKVGRDRRRAGEVEFEIVPEPALAVYPITPELRLLVTQLAETDLSENDLTAMRLAMTERRKGRDEAARERSTTRATRDSG